MNTARLRHQALYLLFTLVLAAPAARALDQSCLAGSWSGTWINDPMTFTLDSTGKITSGRVPALFADLSGQVTLSNPLTGQVTGHITFFNGGSLDFRLDLSLISPGLNGAAHRMAGNGINDEFSVSLPMDVSGGNDCGTEGGCAGGAQAVPKPDLLVTSVALNPAVVVAGTPVRVSATVTNNGAGAASAFFVAFFNNQATPIFNSGPSNATATCSGLGVGQSQVFSADLTYATPGTYTLAVLADSDTHVFETNEINNIFFLRVTVIARGSDLLIKSVQRQETTPGTDALFTVTVENRGALPAGPFQVGFYANRLTAPGFDKPPEQGADVAGLPAQGTATVSFNLPVQNAPRGGISWFVADILNAVAEDVENNNAASAPWGIANDAMSVSSALRANPGATLVGEPVVFSIAVADPNGDPLTYLWNFGDGFSVEGGASMTHAYAAPGSFIASVSIADGPFHRAQSSASVSVETQQLIDLGTVSLSATKGKINLRVPLPAEFSRKDRVKGQLAAGNAGNKARFRNQRLTAKASSTGEFLFVVEYSSRSGRTLRLRYKYAIVE